VRVVVTGHHGFLGSVVAPFLAGAGHEVTGVDSFLYRGCDLFAGEPLSAELERDVRDLRPADLAGYDAVVHLAALSNDPIGEVDRELTLEINHRASVRLGRSAREAGVARFVFASSCSMYGVSGEAPVAEDAPLRPLTAYAESKVRAEDGLTELADDGFSPVFLRCATAYGVSPRLRVDVVLNNLVGWAVTTGRVRILSDGTPWRPLVHAEDIARTVAAVLEAPREAVHGEAFNVGLDSENHRVRELAELVAQAVPETEIEIAGAPDPDERSYRVDFGKLRRALPELELRWTARAGAEELAAAYRTAGMTFEDFDGDRFTRVKRLRRLRAEGALDDSLRPRAPGAVRVDA
jgi:nucleoside-diphosphate-sugar epimerase